MDYDDPARNVQNSKLERKMGKKKGKKPTLLIHDSQEN